MRLSYGTIPFVAICMLGHMAKSKSQYVKSQLLLSEHGNICDAAQNSIACQRTAQRQEKHVGPLHGEGVWQASFCV